MASKLISASQPASPGIILEAQSLVLGLQGRRNSLRRSAMKECQVA